MPRTLLQDLFYILLITAIITLASVLLGIDLAIATRFKEIKLDWAQAIARSGHIPGVGAVLCSAAYLLCCTGLHRLRSPLLLRLSSVMLTSFFIGSIFIVHGLRLTIGRPRPKQIEQFGGSFEYAEPFASFSFSQTVGQIYQNGIMSFPSSQASFAFLVCVPYFVLRKQQPWTARAFLMAGIIWAGLVGLGRFVAMSHFLTDIVWSGTFVLCTATIAAHLNLTFQKEASERLPE